MSLSYFCRTCSGPLVAHSVALNPFCQGLLIGGEADSNAAARKCVLLRSRPGEFHPEPLTELDLILASYGSCHRAKAAAFH